MNVKPWQMIVIVLGLLIGGGLIIYTFATGSSDGLTYSMTLIDAETGDTYTIADYRDTPVILPAARPGTTDKYALIQIEKDDKGKWQVGDGAKRMFGAINVPIQAFDRDSGALVKQPGSTKKYQK